jgi:hypothetical protein
MDSRERLPDWLHKDFDAERMRELTQILTRRLAGMGASIQELRDDLDAGGAVGYHTHVVADITDFPSFAVGDFVLRAGDSMLGNLVFPEGFKVVIGDANQMNIWHTGSDVRFEQPTTMDVRFVRGGINTIWMKQSGEIEFQTGGFLSLFKGSMRVEQILSAANLRTWGDRVQLLSETVGAPTRNALLEVVRGGLPNVALRWNETLDRWEITRDGNNYYQILDFQNIDGDKGDITVSATGTVFTIDPQAVTYAKMQNVSAASKLLGRGDSGAGSPQEISLGTGLAMTGVTLSATGGGGDSWMAWAGL